MLEAIQEGFLRLTIVIGFTDKTIKITRRKTEIQHGSEATQLKRKSDILQPAVQAIIFGIIPCRWSRGTKTQGTSNPYITNSERQRLYVHTTDEFVCFFFSRF